MGVTVVTAALPERAHLFGELAGSMARQTLPPLRWLIEWDYARRGPAVVINELVERIDTEWWFRIDDDDTLEADHFETVAEYLTDAYDVVYTWGRVTGNVAYPTVNQVPFDAQRVMSEPGLPSVAFYRTEFFRQVGGYDPDARHEDWDFWRRAINAGGRFLCVPIVTWTYRLGDWVHRSRRT